MEDDSKARADKDRHLSNHTAKQEVEDDEDAGLDMFEEPTDFRPKTPPPTYATYELQTQPAYTVRMSLVGSHPLWGHHLWNAAPTLSAYITQHAKTLCRDALVLELGAGAGLPSIVAHRLGARLSLATDYPDADLIENLRKNVEQNTLLSHQTQHPSSVAVEGYIWGADIEPSLRKHLTKTGKQHASYFDLVLLSDLIFNHQAHGAMLDTLNACLPPSPASSSSPSAQNEQSTPSMPQPQALVFFTHHRPHLADRDMAFFTLAQERGWTCTEVGRWKMPPMFPEDPGSEEVRATVHGWQVYR